MLKLYNNKMATLYKTEKLCYCAMLLWYDIVIRYNGVLLQFLLL